MLFAVLQALTFVPLIVCALAAEMSLVLIFVTASLYWGLGMSTGPAWTTWASTIVPERVRARHFARRSRDAQGSLVVALLLGGAILNFARDEGQAFPAFALTFLLALGSPMPSLRG